MVTDLKIGWECPQPYTFENNANRESFFQNWAQKQDCFTQSLWVESFIFLASSSYFDLEGHCLYQKNTIVAAAVVPLFCGKFFPSNFMDCMNLNPTIVPYHVPPNNPTHQDISMNVQIFEGSQLGINKQLAHLL